MHSEGRGVVARHIIAHLVDQFDTLIHRRTAGRMIDKLELSWAPMKETKHTFAAYWKVVMRNYLIKLDKYIKDHNKGDDSKVFVFTDESYVNTNHGMKKTYIPKSKDKQSGVKVKSGKGRRLVILHAITLDGPLCDFKEDGETPVCNFRWSGDTCHPQNRKDGRLICETLWVAQSHTGDYHDNMNSEMFMKWLED